MAPRIHASDSSSGAALRRACRATAAEALALLDGPDPSGQRTIHGLRKRIKHLRGLLRLARPGLDGYGHENAVLRDTAHDLAPLRDSDVTLATLDGLPGGVGAFAALHAALQDHHAAVRTEEDTAAILANTRATLRAFRKRAKSWHIRGAGGRTLAKGIALSHDRARKGLARVRLDPTPARLHDWRKSIRYMQYQLRFLEPLWPAAVAPRLAAARDLGEMLGLFNDLDMLSVRADATDLPDDEHAALSKDIAARQSALLARALPLGERLCAGPGKAQGAIWADLWRHRSACD